MRRFCPDPFLLVAILQFAAISVARAFTSCTVSEGTLLESLSELGAGATFLFFFFVICSAAGIQLCSSKRGSDTSVSLLSGVVYHFFEDPQRPIESACWAPNQNAAAAVCARPQPPVVVVGLYQGSGKRNGASGGSSARLDCTFALPPCTPSELTHAPILP